MKRIRKPITKGVAKVPVIMQMEALECGAASLAMVMAYYGKWVPLEQARYDCGVSRDGSNAKNMLLAARNYGFEADGYRFDPQSLKKDGRFPCIIHWNFNHFVVLNGFRGNKAVINDPARGTVKIPMEEFDKAFTGICLMVSPGGSFEPSGKRKSMFEFARKRLSGALPAVVFVALATIISYFFGIINPAMSQLFLDKVLSGKEPGWMLPVIILMLVLAGLQIVVSLVSAVYSLRISGKMSVVGNTTYMWKVLRMPMVFFSQRMSGDIIRRQETNASIVETLVNTVAPLALNAILMVVYLVVMLRLSVVLTFVGVSTILLNLVLSRIIAAKRVNITRVQMRDAGNLASQTLTGISMAETIKAAGAENGFFNRWAGFQASVNSQKVKYNRLNVSLGMIPSFVNTLAGYLVMFIGVWLAMNGRFTVGMIVGFQGFLTGFMTPANTLISAGQTIQEMRTSMERVQDVMEYPADPLVEQCEKIPESTYRKLSGCIELKDITFGYSRLSDPLIRNFSMSLKTGSSVALVGMSGCGKSTVSRLVSGLYRPWSGEILFDGKPIGEINRDVFTGSIAVVDQDITLFEDTVANNIKMWDRTIEDFEMIMAARDAQLHDDIMAREGGYAYRISEGGKDLSGGQRQRLEIARVLAQDPSIIILDEATSALDAKTEYEVVKAIRERGITCIVIAHRLSTIRNCDEIIVLDHGLVVERGTHEELYAKGGHYTELVTSE